MPRFKLRKLPRRPTKSGTPRGPHAFDCGSRFCPTCTKRRLSVHVAPSDEGRWPKLQVRVHPRILSGIDQCRGQRSRSQFVRDCIRQEVSIDPLPA